MKQKPERTKDLAATTMAQKRWRGRSKADRAEHGAMMARARWAKRDAKATSQPGGDGPGTKAHGIARRAG